MARVHLHGRPGIHELKIRAHSLRRRVDWWVRPGRYPAPRAVDGRTRRLEHELHELRVPLRRADGAADPVLEEGKIRNIQLACLAFDDLQISPDRPLSFWRTLGPLRRRDGYRAGLEIHGGCLVPSIGGGVCLLSNALFELAVRCGWHILERHGHTREAVPPTSALWGLDATVHHPYVDLRFAPERGPVRLACRVEAGELVVQAFGAEPARELILLEMRDECVQDGVRAGCLVRVRVHGATGERLGEEVVARSRRQILHAREQARTCRSCGEQACPSRDGFLANLPAGVGALEPAEGGA